MYDAIVVGARVAGSSAARLLARKGHRVLLVDRTAITTDTLSTHFVWPRGASYLLRWGLLDRVLKTTPSGNRVFLGVEGISLEGQVTEQALKDRMAQAHGGDGPVTTSYFSARRRVIDRLLLEAAIEAGVEFRDGVEIEDVLSENGRVVGVRGRTRAGTPFQERARIVIAADGRKSRLADAVKAPKSEVREACTFAAFSYFSGFEVPGVTIERRGRLGLGLTATNDGLNMTLLFGPRDWMQSFQQDRDGNFLKGIRYINEELAEKIAGAKREEPFYITNDQTAFLRKSSGPGYALIGDAACFKDQCTASGMTHAFRDAELISACADRALRGEATMDAAVAEYSEKRFLDSWKYYEFVAAQAEMSPARPEELEIYRALQDLPEQRNKLVGVFGDTVTPKAFFSSRNLREIKNTRLGDRPDYRGYETAVFDHYRNPFSEAGPRGADFAALARTCVDYASPVGPNLLGRIEGYAKWQKNRSRTQTWQYSRTLEAFPGPLSKMKDDEGRRVDGINFASQDYLALGAHPRLKQAARDALEAMGPHSAGSAMVIGNTVISEALEEEIRALTGKKHVVLFPTGWAAGFGSIVGLVRGEDHIVMDRLAHACLQQGAKSATRHIHKHPHLDTDGARALLKKIRSRDKRNAILMISEGIFSMDSDAPDLAALKEACDEFEATLFVDVAHDLGALGPDGQGMLGAQGLFGKVDLVMGSFSKTFASNGGFLATDSEAAKQYVKMFGNSHMFSNALSPIQSAVALEAFRIVRSPEGEVLRGRLMDAVKAMRGTFAEHGVDCLGQPSAIVPVVIGDERVARVAHRLMQKRQIAAMILEYPVVASGSARFRLQVMASHTPEQATYAAMQIVEAIREARAQVLGTSGQGELSRVAVAAPA